jgi:predicted TIM-barrel fold metal-dependent hydrolase
MSHLPSPFPANELDLSAPTIDCHIHLAATGCCAPKGYLSPKLRKRYTIRLLKLIHHITDHDLETTFDRQWPEKIHRFVKASKSLDYGVVLGFDGYYDRNNGSYDAAQTQMLVPSEWVFEICHKYPNLLPGPSINPHRADALDQLEYCWENRAVLIKWLPSAQGIDPASPNLKAFYRRMADTGLPLLVHIGGEKTFFSLNPEFNQIHLLHEALDSGVKIICAHWGTPVLFSREQSQLPQLLELIPRYPNLFFDNSGICNPSRYAHLPKLAPLELLMSRTLYGSDFPVPANAYLYLGKLPFSQCRKIQAETNPFDLDIALKRAFHVPEATLRRGHEVLANLSHWIGRKTDF